VVWAKSFTGDGGAHPSALALDSSGTAVWSGTFTGTVDLGQGLIQGHGTSDDLFVASHPR
jgi:hypothetical protein